MPTTSHYGWDTPADTDYVTNGALAIRTMAQDADDTVYSIDQAKVAKAGDTMTGTLVVPSLNMLQNGSNLVEIIAYDSTGATLRGNISFISNTSLKLYVATNANDLTIDSVGNTKRTSAGVTRPLPFAVAAGQETISANSSVTVSLPSGRFSQIPYITVSPESTSTTVVTGHAGNVSTSSFKIYNTDNATRTFNWHAIQMTATNPGG